MASSYGEYSLTNGAAGMSSGAQVARGVEEMINSAGQTVYVPTRYYYNNTIDTQAIVDSIMKNLNLSDPSSYLSAAKDLADLNTASSQAMAREQMAFQEKANALAMDFSATEAQKTRDWQTMMSDTAHQREVVDLIKAGLNPILSANQGAAVGSAANAVGVTSSGAKGSVDTSVVNAMVSMYQKAMDAQMQMKSLEMQQKQIDAQLLMNSITNETNRWTANRAAQATMYSANANSSAHRYAAELDYSTWTGGLHNQYAQLGEWIYKALTGMNLKDLFNFNFKNEIPIVWKNATYTAGGGTQGAGGGGGYGGAW